MYLLDTDTLTHLYRGNSNVIKRLKTIDEQEFAITVITKVEFLRGRIDYLIKTPTGKDLLRAQELLFRTEKLLNELLLSLSTKLPLQNLKDCGQFLNIEKLAELIY